MRYTIKREVESDGELVPLPEIPSTSLKEARQLMFCLKAVGEHAEIWDDRGRVLGEDNKWYVEVPKAKASSECRFDQGGFFMP